jgi:hypothetical protein
LVLEERSPQQETAHGGQPQGFIEDLHGTGQGLNHRFLSAVYPNSTGIGVVLIGDCDVWSTMSRQYKLLLA